MPGAYLWGWDADAEVFRKVLVDENGVLQTTGGAMTLDELTDVSVAAPNDQYLLYWDAATSLWKCRALVAADLPVLDALAASGVWTAPAAWTLPPITLGGVITGGGQDIAGIGQVATAYSIRKTFLVTGIADNVATNIFTITTAGAASQEAGVYSVFVHACIAHGTSSGNSNTASKSFTAQFCRAMKAGGTGVNSAVSEVIETASAATTSATRDIGAVTMTVVETSEYIQTIQFTIDLTGTSILSAIVTVVVELAWSLFQAAPVLAVA